MSVDEPTFDASSFSRNRERLLEHAMTAQLRDFRRIGGGEAEVNQARGSGYYYGKHVFGTIVANTRGMRVKSVLGWGLLTLASCASHLADPEPPTASASLPDAPPAGCAPLDGSYAGPTSSATVTGPSPLYCAPGIASLTFHNGGVVSVYGFLETTPTCDTFASADGCLVTVSCSADQSCSATQGSGIFTSATYTLTLEPGGRTLTGSYDYRYSRLEWNDWAERCDSNYCEETASVSLQKVSQ
jgi:hypothetical protein